MVGGTGTWGEKFSEIQGLLGCRGLQSLNAGVSVTRCVDMTQGVPVTWWGSYWYMGLPECGELLGC